MKRLTLLILLLVVAQGASAGTQLETETRRPTDDPGRVRKATTYLDGSRFRLDTDDGRRTFVYRGDRELVWIIDHKKRSFIEFERPTAAVIAGHARDRLEKLSPEKRAAVDGAIDVAANAEVDVEVRETGSSDRIQGIPCKEVEVLRGEQRIADSCWATFSDAGVSAESFEAVREVQTLLEESVATLIPGKIRAQGLAILESFGQFDGVPMRARSYQLDSIETDTVVTRIESKPIQESEFTIPKGYRPRIKIEIGGDRKSP